MNYEKYIKYKTKYLNLKIFIQNNFGSENYDNNFQSGGSKEDILNIDNFSSTPNSEIFNNNNLDNIDNLTETPNSEIYNNIKLGGDNYLNKLDNNLDNKLDNKLDNNLDNSLDNIENLSETPTSEIYNNKVGGNYDKKYTEGKRKIKKNEKVFESSDSDSDFCSSDSKLSSDSSLLSLSSFNNY